MDISSLARELRNIVRDCRALLGPGETVNFNGNEADSAALCLQQLCLAHATGVYTLALKSVDLAFPATACSRAAFEAGALAAWMSFPREPTQRLSRWLGHWRTINRFYSKQGEMLEESTPGLTKELMDSITSREVMYERLASTDPKISAENPPKFKTLLRDIGYPQLYSAYCEACEIVHSGPEAVIRTRRANRSQHHPLGFRYACSVNSTDWIVAFQMTGWGSTLATYHALRNHGLSNDDLQPLLHRHKRFDAMTKDNGHK